MTTTSSNFNFSPFNDKQAAGTESVSSNARLTLKVIH